MIKLNQFTDTLITEIEGVKLFASLNAENFKIGLPVKDGYKLTISNDLDNYTRTYYFVPKFLRLRKDTAERTLNNMVTTLAISVAQHIIEVKLASKLSSIEFIDKGDL